MKSFMEEYEEVKLLCDGDWFKRNIEQTKQLLSSKPLVLYGVGKIGEAVAVFCKQHGIAVDCFCDKYRTGVHKETGLTIISPETLVKDFKDATIIVCSVSFDIEIRRELSQLGVAPESVFSRAFFNIHEMTLESFEHHIAGYERCYNLLEDEISRKVLMGRIQCYLLSSPLLSPPLPIL
jgi:hypothetical protein